MDAKETKALLDAESGTFNSISVGPPEFDSALVARVVAEQFGLVGDYSILVSERDQNFRLKTASGDSYVVKVIGAAEDGLETDFQIAALEHLEAMQIHGVPRVVRTAAGGSRSTIHSDDGREFGLRVVTWIAGRLLIDVDETDDIARQFGARLAELDIALQSFTHESDGHNSLWDMQRAAELRTLLPAVSDAEIRDQLEDVLEVFDERVSPALTALSRQVIHNDANPENILLDAEGKVSGIIDFGDLVKAPRVVEVATAAAYLRAADDDGLKIMVPFVQSYHEQSPLIDTEIDLLYDLVRTRLSMTVTLLYWRLKARNEDDPYRKKTLAVESDAFEFLRTLSRLGRAGFRHRIGLNS
jgi:hydroxylysine kinase